MRRLLRFKTPVALLVAGEGRALLRVDLFSEETDRFVFDDTDPLLIREVDGEACLVIAVNNVRHDDERFCVLLSDIESLRLNAQLWSITSRKVTKADPAEFLKELTVEIHAALRKISAPCLHLV